MAIIDQIKLYPLRVLKSLSLYLSMMAIGLNLGMPGPTLLDLQILAQSSFSEISYIMPGRAGGFTIGSLLVGVIYSRVNVQLFLSTCMFASAMLTAGIVFNRTLYGIILTFFFNGICMGSMMAGCNMFIIDIWGKESPTFLQALDFFFGLGAFIAPLIATPFLLPKVDEDEQINETLISLNETSTNHTLYKPEDVKLIYPYEIIAIFSVITALIFLALFIKYRETAPHPSRIDAEELLASERIPASNKLRILIIILMAIFMFFYLGLEITFGSFLTTYAVNSAMKLPKATGALMTSLFWGTFTFFKIFAIVAIDYTGAELNLIFQISLILISNIFLLSWGNSVAWGLWTGTALLGLGASSVFASVFAFIEQYFPVTSITASIFCISAYTGEFVFPTIMSGYLETYPQIFLWITLVCSVMIALLLAISSLIFRTSFRKIDHQ